MNMQETLMAARQQRRNIARQNGAVRQEMMSAINTVRDGRWEARISPNEVLGVANREFSVKYCTTREFDALEQRVELRLHLVVRDGGIVDIHGAGGRIVATAGGAEHGLKELARVITEFEYPNAVPSDYQSMARAS
jgi:hypothetical protein